VFRTKYAPTALATLLASLLGCANDAESSAPTQNGGETPGTARDDTNRPSAGDMRNSTSGAMAIPTAGDTNRPSTGDMPMSTAGTMPMPPSAETPTPATGSIDPTGVWWTEVTTVGSEVLPILDKLTGANIRFVMRVEVSGTAPNNDVKFDFCQLQTEWIDPMDPNNITTIGFRPDTVEAFSESVTVDLGSLSPGSKVPLPSLTFHGGLDESGREFDENGDGNPGVTAWVRTLVGIEIEVYETITIRATLDLTVPDENTLTGTLDFGADALIVSSNNPIIFADTAVTITPDSKAVPITAKRLLGGGDCASLPATIQFTTVPPAPPPLIPPPVPGQAPAP